jgi:hypothetical protein
MTPRRLVAILGLCAVLWVSCGLVVWRAVVR